MNKNIFFKREGAFHVSISICRGCKFLLLVYVRESFSFPESCVREISRLQILQAFLKNAPIKYDYPNEAILKALCG